MAAANIGVRPTLDGGARSIEAYLLDFSDDLYGADMTFELIAFLRPEKRFESLEALVSAMEHDVRRAREILTTTRAADHS